MYSVRSISNTIYCRVHPFPADLNVHIYNNKIPIFLGVDFLKISVISH